MTEQRWAVSKCWAVEPPTGIDRRRDGWYGGGSWFADRFTIEAVQASVWQAENVRAAELWVPEAADAARFAVAFENPGGWTARAVIHRSAAWREYEAHAAVASLGCAIGADDWQVRALRELFASARIVQRVPDAK